MEKIYISGKIGGLSEQEVRAKFEAAEMELTAEGYEVVNPAKNGLPFNAPWEVHVAIDIILLLGCDSIYLLPCWEQSKGATLEKNIADVSGKKLIYKKEQSFVEIKQAISESIGVSFFDIAGDSRKRRSVYARMIFSYYCRKAGATTVLLADEINRNHSTIVYYVRKFNDDIKFNPEFKELVKRFETALSVVESAL